MLLLAQQVISMSRSGVMLKNDSAVPRLSSVNFLCIKVLKVLFPLPAYFDAV